MSKLTKRDIVVSISNQTGMVQHQVFDVVQRTLDQITDSLARNVAVELRNFGVFQPRLTKPRVGRTPTRLFAEAGERIDCPVSLPVPSTAMFAAIATPVPPLEPPGVRVRSYGLRT